MNVNLANKLNAIQGVERRIMTKYILGKMGELVNDDYGDPSYISEADAVLYDVFGYEDLTRKLGKCFRSAQAYRIVDDFGFGTLFSLCNGTQMFSTLKEMVRIRIRLKELRKEIRKGKRTSSIKDESTYLTEMYKKAIKAFRRKAGVKKAPKQRYRARYGMVNDLLETTPKGGWGIFEDDDDYYDDDEQTFDDISLDGYMKFAKRHGYKTHIGQKLTGRAKVGRSRGSLGFDGFMDEDEEDYDLYEKPKKRSRGYSDYDDEDDWDDEEEDIIDPEEVRTKKVLDSMQRKIDLLTNAVQKVTVKDQFENRRKKSVIDPDFLEPEIPDNPVMDEIGIKLDSLTDAVKQMVIAQTAAMTPAARKAAAQMTREYEEQDPQYEEPVRRERPKMSRAEYEELQKIEHSRRFLNDDDEEDGELGLSADEKKVVRMYGPMFGQPEPMPTKMKLSKAEMEAFYGDDMEDDGEDDEPLTREEIETLSHRLSADEVRMLMRSELTEEDQVAMMNAHPELQQNASQVIEVAPVVDAPISEPEPVPGAPVNDSDL